MLEKQELCKKLHSIYEAHYNKCYLKNSGIRYKEVFPLSYLISWKLSEDERLVLHELKDKKSAEIILEELIREFPDSRDVFYAKQILKDYS